MDNRLNKVIGITLGIILTATYFYEVGQAIIDFLVSSFVFFIIFEFIDVIIFKRGEIECRQAEYDYWILRLN